MAVEDLRRRRDAALGAGAALFYRTPLNIVRGQGAYLFDADGRRYVDMYNNVPCVGHAHPGVVEAITRAQSTLNVHSRYLHEGAIALAERLAALHGPTIESLIFSCTGSEANEIALRMARFATGRRGLICTDATYHGNSDLVGRLTRVGGAGTPPPDIQAIPFPQTYRPLAPDLDEDALCGAYLDRLDVAIADLQASDAGVAALIICSIFANEGLPDVPRGFLARAAAKVRAAGGLVIADEVQAGYCRTGAWWGYEVMGFTPDIVVTGKPMGAGVPLAATAASRDLVEVFRARTRYFNTFASSPLQAAAGEAVLDIIEAEGLRDNVVRVGPALKAALQARLGRRAFLGDVRGCGLFIGVEMISDAAKTPDPARAADISERLKEKGFLTAPAGTFGNVVKIRPPLVFSHVDAANFLAAFDEVIGEVDD